MNLAEIGSQLQQFFSLNSYGSILLRGTIWFLVALVIIATTDTSGKRVSGRKVQQNLGMLFLFLLLAGGLVYLLFGFVPMA
jgi:small-conductance mechanosensitive channel